MLFRAFIPLIQQSKFENIIHRIQTFEPKPESQPGISPSAHKVGERRYVSVKKLLYGFENMCSKAVFLIRLC